MFTKTLIDKAFSAPAWSGLAGDSKAIAIAELAARHPTPLVIVCQDGNVSKQLSAKLNFLINNPNLEILEFPSWETLPYDKFSPLADIVAARLLTLHKLQKLQRGIVLATIPALLQRIVPKTFLQQYSLMINKNEELEPGKFRLLLQQRGYYEVEQVLEKGEFAIRGSIIDIFPASSDIPFRLDLFDNAIDTIHKFDPTTQRSYSELEAIQLLPAHEFPLTQEATHNFCVRWEERFPAESLTNSIYQKISAGNHATGAEYYLPLFYSKLALLSDYIPPDSILLQDTEILSPAHQFWQNLLDRHEQLRYDRQAPILPPQELFATIPELTTELTKFRTIKLTEIESSAPINFATTKFIDEAKLNLKKLPSFLLTNKRRVLITVTSIGRAVIVTELLKDNNIEITNFTAWQEFIDSKDELGIIVSPLQYGFSTSAHILITEPQLFSSEIIQHSPTEASMVDNSASVINNLTELTPGDPIVHLEHGIGCYLGLKTIETDGYCAEYLTLEYADNAKLYVPITNLHLITRYIAPNTEQIRYNRLGSNKWERAKTKALQKIRDVAAELLAIYAKRASKKGFNFSKPESNYQIFASSFPFELTLDQKKAEAEIISDMTSTKCMDRLICGDVGFGKTEIALRAAFIAANSGKQVAILTPTTLLTQQHYTTFQDRFKDWPVRIAPLSRFTSTNQQRKIINYLKTGELDIVISTHRLLSKDIVFHDLGLLVIDEEHRFGVEQKEKIKALRTNIDILTLTATPIPRTLSMSLTAIRDLSIIATPPAKRLAIKTFINEFEHKQIIKEAVSREILRGGQVYYLHNNVSTIEKKVTELTALVPTAKIKFAHGQMPKQQLEQIMVEFYHLRFNLLVSTTIIESGIDIPTANTIIIERADKFGLAQLYQLRGRVGRSHHQAYAYLLIPERKLLTKDANKRLEAFSHLDKLGVGFTLASYDLEIRGAGEILGKEQSGQIHAIGYSLYLEILQQTVNSIAKGKELDLEQLFKPELEIELQVPAFIPETYIHDIQVRLSFYKRIAIANRDETLQQLQVELIDRFGLQPEPVKNLFAQTSLKLLAKAIGIKNIKTGTNYCYIGFGPNPLIDSETMLTIIQTQPSKYRLSKDNTLQCKLMAQDSMGKIVELTELLESLNS